MKYVVAVSGGVDSVVLLDMLSRQPIEIVVAHVDHGIRADSAEDERFVRSLAENYGYPYESVSLELGAAASEEQARHMRYHWLEQVRVTYGADGIATAHHQDDVLETMCLNMLRGTGWRGLSSLRATPSRFRPLLEWSKAMIVDYALERGLSWREDSTNDQLAYYRNRIRVSVVQRLSSEQRRSLVELYRDQVRLREEIDKEIEQLRDVFIDNELLKRYETMMLDDSVAHEVVRVWLGSSLEQKRIRELLLFLKTGRIGSRWSLDHTRFLLAKTAGLIVERPRD